MTKSLKEEFVDQAVWSHDCKNYQAEAMWEFIVDKVGETQEKLMNDLQKARSERDALNRKVAALESEIARLVAERNS